MNTPLYPKSLKRGPITGLYCPTLTSVGSYFQHKAEAQSLGITDTLKFTHAGREVRINFLRRLVTISGASSVQETAALFADVLKAEGVNMEVPTQLFRVTLGGTLKAEFHNVEAAYSVYETHLAEGERGLKLTQHAEGHEGEHILEHAMSEEELLELAERLIPAQY